MHLISVPAGSAVLPPDRAGSPGSLIVTFAGSVSARDRRLDRGRRPDPLLGVAGHGEPSVRQALVRLKSRGFLAAERRAGEAGYRADRRRSGRPGDRRPANLPVRSGHRADGWVLAVFSVPETDRHLRHQLRSELAWLGFGTVSAGVWIAPRPLADPTRALLADAGLDGYVTWFAAQHLTEIDVAAWWDLDSLRGQYETFLAEHRPVAPAPNPAKPDVTDEQAFARYLRLIDDWRLFPRLDPGLPDVAAARRLAGQGRLGALRRASRQVGGRWPAVRPGSHGRAIGAPSASVRRRTAPG